MKRFLTLSLILLCSLSALAQSGSLSNSGIFLRVNDTTTYQSAAAAKHALGYSDIYWNNQATTPHFDIWNGSSYDHVFVFGGGSPGGGTALSQKTETGTTYTVTDADNNYVIHFSNASGVTVTMPNTVSDDTYVTFIRDEGAGVITFVEGGTSVFHTLGDEVTIDEEKAWTSWIKDGATDWYAAGGLGPTGGGGGTWGTITGDPADQTDLAPYILSTAVANSITNGVTTSAPNQDQVFDALAGKSDKESFTTLTFASPTNWDCLSKQYPMGKVTATGDFTINMTNVKNGAQGVLKLIKNTASDLTLTFDTDFTNKQLNATLLTYTFSGSSGNEYFLSFVADGTSIEWIIGDVAEYTSPITIGAVRITSNQAVSDNTYQVISWSTEDYDDGAIFDLATDASKIYIPGSGGKLATVTVQLRYAANATGNRRIRIYKNGADANFENLANITAATGGAETFIRSTFQIVCTGGDYLQVVAYQNSGGSINLVSQSTICTVQILDL